MLVSPLLGGPSGGSEVTGLPPAVPCRGPPRRPSAAGAAGGDPPAAPAESVRARPFPISPPRSLELLFANSQNNKLLYGEPPKSPRANRKFSSPPPLSISKSSSPSRRRKLSLNIPIITGGKALDLAALSCSSNGYASMYSSMAPFSKTTLDINKLYVSSNFPNKIPDEGEAATEKQEESAPSKQSECRGWACGAGRGGWLWWALCRGHRDLCRGSGTLQQLCAGRGGTGTSCPMSRHTAVPCVLGRVVAAVVAVVVVAVAAVVAAVVAVATVVAMMAAVVAAVVAAMEYWGKRARAR